MILKAGTYTLNAIPKETYPLSQTFDFTLIRTIDGETIEQAYIGMGTELYQDTNFSVRFQLNSASAETLYYNPVPSGNEALYPNGWMGGSVPSVRIDKDTNVVDDFGTWFIESTNYNEVNAKPLATIEYNGETIAQLNAGETATLSCKEEKMFSDVVVKTNYVPSGDGSVVPFVAKQNGTYHYTYETATITFQNGDDLVWSFTTDEGTSFALTNFIVPMTTEDALNKLFYTTFRFTDGTTETIYFEDIEGDGALGAGHGILTNVLLLVKDANYWNNRFNTSMFEDNKVYIQSEGLAAYLGLFLLSGRELSSISITYASKFIEFASFFPVTVDVKPILIEKTIEENGTYIATDENANNYFSITAEGYSKVIINTPSIIPVAELPTENVDDRNVYEKGQSLYKLNKGILTGDWTISKQPFPNTSFSSGIHSVNFICNAVAYTKIEIQYDNIDYWLYYINDTERKCVYGHGSLVFEWADDIYRNVKFTSENAEILNWLNKNDSRKTSGEWIEYARSN